MKRPIGNIHIEHIIKLYQYQLEYIYILKSLKDLPFLYYASMNRNFKAIMFSPIISSLFITLKKKKSYIFVLIDRKNDISSYYILLIHLANHRKLTFSLQNLSLTTMNSQAIWMVTCVCFETLNGFWKLFEWILKVFWMTFERCLNGLQDIYIFEMLACFVNFNIWKGV